VFKIGAVPKPSPPNKKENVMLKKLAAALIATTVIAAPAFAQSSGTAGTTPAAQSGTTQPVPGMNAKVNGNVNAKQTAPAANVGTQTNVNAGKRDVNASASARVGGSKTDMSKTKTASHVRKHHRKHVVHSKVGKSHQARRGNPVKTHQARSAVSAKRS
jgi:hypothetical protein